MTTYIRITDLPGDNTRDGTANGLSQAYRFFPGTDNETITNFADGEDVIDLSRFATISDFSDLTITSDDDGVTIDLTEHGGSTIRLEGFDIANLNGDDFLFRVNQTIEGDENKNVLRGDTGDDTITGGAETTCCTARKVLTRFTVAKATTLFLAGKATTSCTAGKASTSSTAVKATIR